MRDPFESVEAFMEALVENAPYIILTVAFFATIYVTVVLVGLAFEPIEIPA